LPLPVSERKLLLFIADSLALVLVLLGILAWRAHASFSWGTIVRHPGWFVLLLGLWATLALLSNAYDLRRAARIRTGVPHGATLGALVAGIYLTIPYITPALHTSRLTAASFVLATMCAVAAGRAGYALLLAQPVFRQRALIVGAGGAGCEVVEAIRARPHADYDLVGFVDDDEAKQGETIAGLPVLGDRHALRRLVRDTGVSEVIVAITNVESMKGELVQAVLDCREQGIQVTAMQGLYERLTSRVPLEHAGRALHVVLPLDREVSLLYPAFKRGMDVALGSLGAVLVLVLVPLVALAHRLGSPGPLFYRQVRVGQGGRPFTLLKFRTMVPDAEADGPQWAQDGDARITKVGRILRRLHLDEVPQAVNLLRGEMSIIGPRPERPEFVATLAQQIPFYRARHAVRPGVTGWAQVNYRYGSSAEDALVKLQYDLYYIKRCSLFLDLQILARTVGLVLTLRGR
jgi:exopolysaccharide biosynthesis polyprenyl glycosylphosphotransferase